jgi:CheY-like chemotaxis protein
MSFMPEPLVLFIEDEEGDVLLLRRALKRAGVANPLETVEDGRAAMDYLAGTGRFADRTQYPAPALVLLDLNLPGPSGFDVLEWMRQQPALAGLPVVICTSSISPADRERAQRLGATDYLIKTARFEEVAHRVRDMAKTLALPNGGRCANQTS